MNFFKWWLKNINWKENFQIFFICLFILLICLAVFFPIVLIDKYYWAKIYSYIFLSIIILIILVVFITNTKTYFNNKKKEYKNIQNKKY